MSKNVPRFITLILIILPLLVSSCQPPDAVKEEEPPHRVVRPPQVEATGEKIVQRDLSFSLKSIGNPLIGPNSAHVEVHNRTSKDRYLSFILKVISPAGEETLSSIDTSVFPDSLRLVSLDYPTPEKGKYRIWIMAIDTASDAIVYWSGGQTLRVHDLLELSLDRTYYTREEKIRCQIELNIPLNLLSGTSLEICLYQGEPEKVDRLVRVTGEADYHQSLFGKEGEGLVSERHVAPLEPGAVRVEFDAERIHIGKFSIRAELKDIESQISASARIVSQKLPPKNREVKIDFFTNNLLLDGTPFFPVGLYWLRKDILSDMKSKGFNSGDYYPWLTKGQINELMDAARDSGMMILLELSEFLRVDKEPDLEGIRNTVSLYKDHPALLLWYLIDEPVETDTPPSTTQKAYDLVRELDPYHPVYMVNNRPNYYDHYAESSDILAIDPYPIPKYPPSRVSDLTDRAKEAVEGKKPVWVIPQAFGATERWDRTPTPEEERLMTYLALVHRAKGILFYRYCEESERNIQPLKLWQEVVKLAKEIGELSPVLLSHDYRGNIAVDPDTLRIDTLLKEHDGSIYIFVANRSKDSLKMKIHLEDIEEDTEAQILYEDETIIIKDGLLADKLKGYQVRIYKVVGSMQ